MKKTVKIARWVAINGAFVAFMYMAFVENISGAQNVVQFFAWFSFVVGAIMFHPEAPALYAKDNEAPSAWYVIVDGAYDIAVAVTFVWVGWIWTAIAYLIAALSMTNLHNKVAEIEARKVKQ